MTLDQVRARVAEVRALASDDEAAHSAEDDLRAVVLRAIADGAADPQELARIVLGTSAIEFSTWCA